MRANRALVILGALLYGSTILTATKEMWMPLSASQVNNSLIGKKVQLTDMKKQGKKKQGKENPPNQTMATVLRLCNDGRLEVRIDETPVPYTSWNGQVVVLHPSKLLSQQRTHVVEYNLSRGHMEGRVHIKKPQAREDVWKSQFFRWTGRKDDARVPRGPVYAEKRRLQMAQERVWAVEELWSRKPGSLPSTCSMSSIDNLGETGAREVFFVSYDGASACGPDMRAIEGLPGILAEALIWDYRWAEAAIWGMWGHLEDDDAKILADQWREKAVSTVVSFVERRMGDIPLVERHRVHISAGASDLLADLASLTVDYTIEKCWSEWLEGTDDSEERVGACDLIELYKCDVPAEIAATIDEMIEAAKKRLETKGWRFENRSWRDADAPQLHYNLTEPKILDQGIREWERALKASLPAASDVTREDQADAATPGAPEVSSETPTSRCETDERQPTPPPEVSHCPLRAADSTASTWIPARSPSPHPSRGYIKRPTEVRGVQIRCGKSRRL